VTKLLDESGRVTNESTRDFLKQFMEAFAKWIERVGG